MSFISYDFFAFVLILLVLYYLIPYRCRWGVLLLGSMYFYLCSGFGTAVYIWFTIAVTYVCSLAIERFGTRRTLFFALGVGINVLLLVYTKYAGFIVGTFNPDGAEILNGSDVIVPLGISFYTLQTIGYLADVKRGTIAPVKNPLKLALFISFFPQLVQGPISRFGDLSHTLYNVERFEIGNLYYGLQRIIWGLFKKLVVADRVFVAVNEITNNIYDYNGGMVLCMSACRHIHDADKPDNNDNTSPCGRN